MLLSPGSVGAALRSGSQHVASSVNSVWRAHTSHALRWSASETKLASSAHRVLIRPLRRYPAESSQVRVRAFPLLFSATVPGFRCSKNPPPPNNSFKPTPHRGVNSVLCATLARCRRPAVGRLNSSVRRQKAFFTLCCSCFSIAGFFCSALRNVCRLVFLRLPCGARSGLACVMGQWRVWFCRLLTSGCAGRVRGAPGVFCFGFRQRRRCFVLLGFLRA
jgi:hypothetical protein